MTEIRKATDSFQPGTWRRANRDGHLVVNLCCPDCGAYGTLDGPEGNHLIDSAGLVTPSVQCNCGFHDMICLLNY